MQVKYSGSKPYNQSFIHEGTKQAHKFTRYTMEGLVPGSIYKFEVYGRSVCRDGVHAVLPNGVKTVTAGEHRSRKNHYVSDGLVLVLFSFVIFFSVLYVILYCVISGHE